MMFGIFVAVCAYLLGSIPTGYLAGRIMGIDIRTMGSGNIGATNAFRILGKKAGTAVLLIDALKGWLAVAIIPNLLNYPFQGHPTFDRIPEIYRVVAAISVILGHNYTLWLNFKGGKGIATSAGVLIALVPWTFVIALTAWIIVTLITRYVSAGSIAAAISLPIASWAVHYSNLMIGICAVMGALAIWKHKANLKRLMNGTENKIGSKKAVATSEVSS